MPPVAHVGDGGEHISPEAGELGPIQQRNPRYYHRKHQEEGGKEPPRPPEPEVAELEASRGLPLAEEQIRYQVTTQGKEHTNPEQPPWCSARIQVVGDHGYGPQPVEPWHVTLGAPYRLRHDASPQRSWSTMRYSPMIRFLIDE